MEEAKTSAGSDSRGEDDDYMLDRAVLAKLPALCSIISISKAGDSPRVTGVKIVVGLQNGATAEFFKKDAPGPTGRDMMKGSFESETVLYSHLPNHVPKPVAWGTYENDPDRHFYLCNFVDMRDELPTASAWASTVAKLHLSSTGKSPNGQFGFHVATHLANIPVNNTWNSSWEALWKQHIEDLFDRDDQVNGLDDELTKLKQSFLNIAIPRYLRPLESDGRTVSPCLIHSDLWPGNIKPMSASDELCVFDACAYWGHNEADLAICRNPRYKLGPACIHEYFKDVAISEPTTDFDGRNAVYAIKYHTLLAIMYHKDPKFRDILRDELRAVMDRTDLPIPVTERVHL